MPFISILYLCNVTLSIVEKDESSVEHNKNILNIIINTNIFLLMEILVLYLFLVLGILNFSTQLKIFLLRSWKNVRYIRKEKDLIFPEKM